MTKKATAENVAVIRDRVRELRRVPASELLANPRNWRTHPKRQREALRGVLSEVGYAGALLARELADGSLELIDGHLRAETTPDQTVPVLVLDVTQDEADKLLATLDPLGAMAEADTAKLDNLLDGLKANGDAMQGLLDTVAREYGSNQSPVSGGTPGSEDVDVPDDAGHELADTWGVEIGQVWKLGKHRLLCGDGTKAEGITAMMRGELADGLVTDPPYSSGGFTRGDRTATTGTKYRRSDAKRKQPDFSGDNRDQRSWGWWCQGWLSTWLGHVSAGAVLATWIDWRQLPTLTDVVQAAGWVWRGVAVWDKTNGARPDFGRFRAQCEYLVWGSAGPLPRDPSRPCLAGCFHQAVEREKEHVTQKPVPTVAWSIGMVPVGGLFVDPFAGSGSAIVAAEQTGRRCYAAEITREYAGLILQRWHQATGGTPERIT